MSLLICCSAMSEPLRYACNYLTHLSLVSFYGTSANSAEPDQKLQNAVSDQARHYLLTEGSIKIRIKWKNTTQQPLKQKKTGPIGKGGKSH